MWHQITMVAVSENDTGALSGQKKVNWVVDLDVTDDQGLKTAIERPLLNLTIDTLSDFDKELLKNSLLSFSLFCERHGEDSAGRAFRLTLQKNTKSEKVVFLTALQSKQVVAEYERIAHLYLIEANRGENAIESLLAGFLRTSAQANLATLVFSDLRFTGYE